MKTEWGKSTIACEYCGVHSGHTGIETVILCVGKVTRACRKCCASLAEVFSRAANMDKAA